MQIYATFIAPRLDKIEETIDDLRKSQPNPEKITEMIRRALENNQARGWTARERWMGIGLFVATLVTLAINILNATGQ